MLNLQRWLITQLMFCFTFFDKPDGTGNGGGDTTTVTDDIEVPDSFNMNDMKGIIKEAIIT